MQLMNALIVAGVAPLVAAAAGGRSLRLSQSQLSVANSSQPTGVLTPNLMILADKCQCKFVGLCTCPATVEFMDCVADACASGACECEPADFVNSCNSMAVTTCPSAGLQCTQEKATCLHTPEVNNQTVEEIQAELEALRVRKCHMKKAEANGYLNAEARLAEFMPRIQGGLDHLKEKGAEPYYMGCAPGSPIPADSTAGWYQGNAVATTAAPTEAPVVAAAVAAPAIPLPVTADKTSMTPEEAAYWSRFRIMFINISVYVLLVLLCAKLYDTVRHDTKFPQKEGFNQSSGFTYGLFGCFSDFKTCSLGFCCPILRWADTMDKAHYSKDQNAGHMTYWPGVLIMAVLMALEMYVGGAALFPFASFIFGLAMLSIQVIQRQRLRRSYNMDNKGSIHSFVEDFFIWACCPCCAVVQEARQVEAEL